MHTEAVLLLGGNLGDPAATLDRAERLLHGRAGEVLARSRDHWTEPWGFDTPHLFLNRALLLRTALGPEALLHACLATENGLGRTRSATERYTDRTIDIDILLIGDRLIDLPALHVPHPRMHQRSFALAPAADIVPSWRHPALHRTVLELLNAV